MTEGTTAKAWRRERDRISLFTRPGPRIPSRHANLASRATLNTARHCDQKDGQDNIPRAIPVQICKCEDDAPSLAKQRAVRTRHVTQNAQKYPAPLDSATKRHQASTRRRTASIWLRCIFESLSTVCISSPMRFQLHQLFQPSTPAAAVSVT